MFNILTGIYFLFSFNYYLVPSYYDTFDSIEIHSPPRKISIKDRFWTLGVGVAHKFHIKFQVFVLTIISYLKDKGMNSLHITQPTTLFIILLL